MSVKKEGINTRAVSSGELKLKEFGNVVTPVFQNTTFIYPNYEKDAVNNPATGKPYIYTRLGNPTVNSMEQKYASLEGARYGISFSSGMSAISCLMLSILKRGMKVLSASELYGQTYSFFTKKLLDMGIDITFIGTDELNKGNFQASDYNMIYAESITNPTEKVTDIDRIGSICSESETSFVVDATFVSPVNQNPLDLGADYVIHSGTKYLSGHSDAICGFIGLNEEPDKILDTRTNFGPVIDPFQAFLIARGMKTIGIRVERQNRNAMKIAEFMEQNRNIDHVFYPGLKSDPYNEIAMRNMRGFGGMLSFEVKGGLENARKFMSKLKIVTPAPSLGGVESLATLPVDTSHSSMPKAQREKIGIRDGLIRFSCGIEDEDDLLEDISNALDFL
ncbi:MAG: trans-sulfuration enzyme family protein [Thermoplasmataceae archaeon]